MIEDAAKSYKKLRIFVASPDDVAVERARLQTVIDEFNRMGSIADYLGLALEMLDWRTVVPLMGRPEEVVLNQLPVQIWDIFVGILWLRFGSQTGALKPGTSEQFDSGTEEEFWLAYNATKKHGRPKVLFYRCTRVPVSLEEIDPDQFKRVKMFFDGFQPSADHPGLLQKFQTPQDFERRIRQDLTKLLLEYSKEVLHHDQPPPPSVVEFAAPRIPDNLPRRDPFFGRDEEIAKALKVLSPAHRSWGIVIDGIGGIGKTALAIEVAHICKERGLFDAFICVTAKRDRLKPTGIEEQTPAATSLDEFINESARELGQNSIVRLTNIREKQHALHDALRDRRALLIFDNLETLPRGERDAVSAFVEELPEDCKAIITSRWRVGDSAFPLRLDKLKWEEARDLIKDQVDRYEEALRPLRRAGEDGWKRLYDNAGGSPLAMLCAIGLIRVRRLTFEDALGLMCDGSRETDLNQFIYGVTLSMLDEHEKETLGALSLFGGAASFDALVETTNLGRHALDSVLERLLGFSLVNLVERAETQELVEDCYTLHPLTKRLARAHLTEDRAAADALEARFIEYWVGFAVRYGSADDVRDGALDQLETEWTNLEAAAQLLLGSSTERGTTAEDKIIGPRLIELTRALRSFLQFSGRLEERILLCTRAYDEACALGARDEAGWFAYDIANDNCSLERLDEASAWIDKCAKVWAKREGKKERIALYRIRGLLAQHRREYFQAEGFLKRALALELELNLETFATSTLNELSSLAYERKRYKDARKYLRQAMEIAVKLNDREEQAVYSANLGSLALVENKLDEAFDCFNQGLTLARECGLIELSGGAQYGLARVLKAQGQKDLALRMANEALAIYERLRHAEVNDVRELVESLEMMEPDSSDI